jgi:hypothetical protein
MALKSRWRLLNSLLALPQSVDPPPQFGVKERRLLRKQPTAALPVPEIVCSRWTRLSRENWTRPIKS